MKVIFLDIDGVANCSNSMRYFAGIDSRGCDPDLVARVNRIVRETGAEVVLSSTWRLWDDWREAMRKIGMDFDFMDRTPIQKDRVRGWEIRTWLEKNRGMNIEKYVIIDDDSDMLIDQPLFQTRNETGLTEEITNAVIAYLNNETHMKFEAHPMVRTDDLPVEHPHLYKVKLDAIVTQRQALEITGALETIMRKYGKKSRTY